MRYAAALVLSMAIAASAVEQPEITVLDNGLTVQTLEMHYAPFVVSVVSYRVGSRDEVPGILGMSHFVEHMMFKGTPEMPKGRFWQIVQRDGGMANAFTMEDATCYYLVLPSARLVDALDIESGRMTGCLIDSAEVRSERSVVLDERRLRSVDDPWGALYEALGETAYVAHPYGNPVIGYDEDIEAYCCETAGEYYGTYYCPANAVLTLVGDFDTDSALAMVEERFGDIPGGATAPGPGVVEPRQEEARHVEIEHPSTLPRVIMAFHGPAGETFDSVVLSLVTDYLTGGRVGRLEELLVETGLVRSVSAYCDAGIDPGLFTVSMTLKEPGSGGLTHDEAVEAVWEELEALGTEGLPEEEVDRIAERAAASEMLSVAYPTWMAVDLGLGMTLFGDPMHSQQRIATMGSVTPADVRDVASSYLRRDGMTTAYLLPTGQGGGTAASEQQALPTDISEPTSIDWEGLEIPDDLLLPPTRSVSEGLVSYELENGLVLQVLEEHSFPVAAISFSTPLGSLRHPSDRAGLAGITADMMMRGPEGVSYADFHARLEDRGSGLSFGAGSRWSGGSVRVLSGDLGLAIGCIGDLLARPAFRGDDFDQVVDEAATDLEGRSESIFAVAGDSLDVVRYGRGMAWVPTMEALEGITLDDAVSFHAVCCRPEGTVLTVVGDVDAEEVLELTVSALGDWENPDTPLPEAAERRFREVPGDTALAPMPGRVQAAVLISRPAPGWSEEPFVAFEVMNTIMGEGIGSRLGRFVRDDQGLAYAVGSWVSSTDSTGVLSAYMATLGNYADQALSSSISEMERMTTEEVAPMELRLAQAGAVGSHALGTMRYDRLASHLTDLAVEGRPADWDLIYLDRALELTPADLREAAAGYIVPGEWFVSAAGGLAPPEQADRD